VIGTGNLFAGDISDQKAEGSVELKGSLDEFFLEVKKRKKIIHLALTSPLKKSNMGWKKRKMEL
jgi:hypothetical protein